MKAIGLSVFVILTATIVVPVSAHAEYKLQVGHPTMNMGADNTAALNNNTFSVPTSVTNPIGKPIPKTTLPANMRGQAPVADPTKQETRLAPRVMPGTHLQTSMQPWGQVRNAPPAAVRNAPPAGQETRSRP
jgi:hypothetical protein